MTTHIIATAPPTTFDAIVVVDWSASSTPKVGADSIWSVWWDARTGEGEPVNHSTRRAARDHLVQSLLDRPAGTRVLVGIDVSLGFPAGFAARAGLLEAAPHGTPPWLATWRHLATVIEDDDRNANNRWAVAADLNQRLGAHHFWGVPAAHATDHLTTTKPARTEAHLAELRVTEQHLTATGHRPFAAWQLLGTGSVGSQTLTAIPVLHHVRTHAGLADQCAVWPFETGHHLPTTPDIVIAEVWPSALEQQAVDREPYDVKDARQVVAMARRIRQVQRSGALGDWFTLREPIDAADDVQREEGWVLGVR